MNRYIAPLTIVFIAAGIFVFFVDGGYRSVSQLREREQSLAKFIEDANTANEKLEDISSEFNSFPEGANDRLLTLLPDRIDPVKYIVNINHIAELHGLLLSQPNVSVQTPTEDDTTEIVRNTLHFRVNSTYSVLKDFLHDVEKSLALQDVHAASVKVSSNEDEEKHPDTKVVVTPGEVTVLSYDIELVSYSLR